MWEKEGFEEEIIEKLGRRAASYVPEWKLDPEHPDPGTALALAYAGMLAGTLGRLRQAVEKHHIAFLNEMGAGRFPAEPARGHVAFSLAEGQTEGTQARAGTMVSALAEGEGNEVLSYKTLDDVYVTPAHIADIYETNGSRDYIGCLYEKSSGEDGELTGNAVIWPEGQTIFGAASKNLQMHRMELYFGSELYLRGAGTVELEFLQKGGYPIPEYIAEWLMNPSAVRFEYRIEDGYQGFERQECMGSVLRFFKGEKQPAAFCGNHQENGYTLRCTVLDPEQADGFSFETVRIGTAASGIAPDNIYGGGIQCGKGAFYPFGERPTEFSEVYFGSGEALCKRGARLELEFMLDFTKVPLAAGEQGETPEWKWVMKKEDFEIEPQYDVTVDAVLWEYYNGIAWARLFPDDQYEQTFQLGKAGNNRLRKISFLCPLDIEPLVVDSCFSFYIRARIYRMGNFYKMRGAYITPVIREPVFSFSYEGRERNPLRLRIWNNLEQKEKKPDPGERLYPFGCMEDRGKALYFGFDQPLCGEPVKLYLQIKGRGDRTQKALLWEYFDGKGWKEADLVDGTGNFSSSGIITLTEGCKFQEKKLFGKTRRWLRVRDIKGGFGKIGEAGFPVLSGIWLNVTPIVHADKEETEYFRMDKDRENRNFCLTAGGLSEATVFVREAQGRFSSWERWECGEDFDDARPGDRFCVLDRTEGVLRFGDGRSGRIPPVSSDDNIRVEYCLAGGRAGNVKKGAVNRLEREIGFINGIYNPEDLSGGFEVEETEDAALRRSSSIRHQNRAVTAGDFESIACHSSRSVRRAACFSGRDESGKKCSGAITLVLLLEDPDSARSRFEAVQREVQRCLEDKTGENVVMGKNLFIRCPEFISICVRIKVRTGEGGGIFSLRNRIQEHLTRFLNPLNGNFHHRGWEVGTLPNLVQIKNAAASVPGVLRVEALSLYGYEIESGNEKEVDLQRAEERPYVLPLCGRHEITVLLEDRQER